MTRDSIIRTVVLCAALAAIPHEGAAQQPLGRLFYTPAERATLDTARSKKTRVILETEGPTEKPAAPPAPEVVTYDGIVRRSDGRSTVWLNNQPIQDKDIRAGSTMVGKVRPDGTVTVQSAQVGRPLDLKVGQRAEMLSGTVEESYARSGTVPARPPAEDTKPAPKAPEGNAAEREAAARHRERDTEDALRAIQEAASRPAPPPPAPPQPLQRFPR